MPFSGIQKPGERTVTHDPVSGMELPKYVSYDSGGKGRNLRYRLRWPMSMIQMSKRNGDNERRRQKSSNFNSLEELLMSDAYAKVPRGGELARRVPSASAKAQGKAQVFRGRSTGRVSTRTPIRKSSRYKR